MARVHVFADESGNFDFSSSSGASRFFILATVTFFDDRQACADLESLRYDLAWRGIDHPGPFHATEDLQLIRDEVFRCLGPHAFRIDATILEKNKARPELRASDRSFYRFAWWMHMKYVSPEVAQQNDELLVIAASIGTRQRRVAFRDAVHEVMTQITPTVRTRTAAWRDDADTGLQVADYCAWALKRKWEDGDLRSYDLIRDRIRSEFDVFRRGTTRYY